MTMGRHTAGRGAPRWLLPVLGVLGVTGLVLAGALAVLIDSPSDPAGTVARLSCDRPLRVVTATSFAPVLDAAAVELSNDDDCIRLDVSTADGRDAVQRATEINADVWIPDDTSWVGSAGTLSLAQAPTANAGAVLATSPLFMVADKATGAQLEKAGASWLALARRVDDGSARLVVRDPAKSGDGMIAAAAVAESVWLDQDMDASALWLARAHKTSRTVTDGRPAMPAAAGEVGVVPEYALLPALTGAGDLTVLPGTDHTAQLRYTWYPMTSALTDPGRAAALDRLFKKLTSPAAAGHVRSARLRGPDAAQAPGDALPPLTAKAFDPLGPHHVDHVFATWYVGDRKTNLLVVVDVSGSMASPAAGSKSSRIELVRQGSRSVAGLLPDESRMGLWEFGSQLDGSKDYKSLLGMAALGSSHRRALSGAINKLEAKETGTGLYDTILAAYTSARNAYRPGVPNQVLIFTDGRNESDDTTMTPAQLAAALKKAGDPKRPILLSVVTFGSAGEAKIVEDAIKPVEGYVDALTTAEEVAAVFIHVAAGGLHH
jgi:Bacterial extracellular solute-binding protein/von Willebrand factor type A domain